MHYHTLGENPLDESSEFHEAYDTQVHRIFIDGAGIDVTQDLKNAPLCLRNAEDISHVWIDAICMCPD
jgi:hypothetical protein